MDWRLRSMRRPTVNEPGHAHALTFSCFHRFPFLQAERTQLCHFPHVDAGDVTWMLQHPPASPWDNWNCVARRAETCQAIDGPMSIACLLRRRA